MTFDFEVWNFDKVETFICDKESSNHSYSDLWDYCISVFSPTDIALLIALEEGKTQSQIAKEWDVNKSNISRRLDKIREILKPFLIERKMIEK